MNAPRRTHRLHGLRLALAVLGGLALLVIGAVAWLVATTAGARLVAGRAIADSGGRLSIGAIDGRLAGRLRLADLAWRDAGVDLHIAHADVEADIAALFLHGLVHVQSAELADMRVALAPSGAPADEPATFPRPPLPLAFDAVRLVGLDVRRDGQRVLAATRLDFAGLWNAAGIGLDHLHVEAEAGRLDLTGQIGAQEGHAGKATLDFDWTLDGRPVAGTLGADGDGRTAKATLALRDPAPARLDVTLTQTGESPWQATLRVPRFAAEKIGVRSFDELAIALDGSGDRRTARLTGSLDLDAHAIRLDPLQLHLDRDALALDTLSLRAADAPGRLNANGRIDLHHSPPVADLDLHWADVELPAELAGQILHSRGALHVAGNRDDFTATGTLGLGPPGQPTDVAVDLGGSADALAVHRLALTQARGALTASGEIRFAPHPAWDLALHAERFDPGAFVAEWPGALDFALNSHGSLTDRGPEGRLRLERLAGQLRRRAVQGQGDLAFGADRRMQGELRIASGRSRVTLTGQGGAATDARLDLAIAELGDFVPEATGSLTGQVTARGTWPKLGMSARLTGERLAVAGWQAGSLALNADVGDAQALSGRLAVRARDVHGAGLAFGEATLDLDGERSAHRLHVAARGQPLSLDLRAQGAQRDDGWNGSLAALDLDLAGQGRWQLASPAALRVQEHVLRLDEACLMAEASRLCLAGNRDATGAARLRYRIEQVPLGLVATLAAADLPLAWSGTLDGEGDLESRTGGRFAGSARLVSAAGGASPLDRPDRPLLDYRDARIEATFGAAGDTARLHADLGGGGVLDGTLRIDATRRELAGEIRASLTDLAVVELFTSELVDVKGRLDGRLVLAGTLDAPRATGTATLADFAADVPATGIRLREGRVTADFADDGRIGLQGDVASGSGRLRLTGSSGGAGGAPFAMHLEGQDVLAADLPGVHVVADPDLTLTRTPQRVALEGTLGVPSANVDLARLPGDNGVTTSPDVVVIDAPPARRERAAPLPLMANVLVRLGDAVAVRGHGLDGKLAGQLTVIDRPAQPTLGRGELRVSGTYRAYGQNLRIDNGRLLYANSVLDNPGLDLRATRDLRDATVGLRVQGTARAPVMTVFSDPPMEQSEALSYLVTGRPLSALGGEESSMVGTAARALGAATGDLLARSIGARLGVEATVSDNAVLGGAAFTIGKYLSPKLYLSYGVGLFTPGEVITLRYLLSKRWNLEAQSAGNENRAGISYRYEK